MYLDWYKIASFLRCLSISGTFPKRSVVTLTKCIGVYFLECTQFTHLLSFVSLFGIRDILFPKLPFLLFSSSSSSSNFFSHFTFTFSTPPISGAFQVDCTNHLVHIYISASPLSEREKKSKVSNCKFCFRILALSSHSVRGQASHEHLCQYIYRPDQGGTRRG